MRLYWITTFMALTMQPFVKAENTVTARLALSKDDSILQFRLIDTIKLGKNPRVVQLPSEKKPGQTNANPHPEDANKFARACSGIKFLDEHSLLATQDTRSELARIIFQGDWFKNLKITKIDMVKTINDPAQLKLEDPRKDYKSFRKKHKRDYEAITALPDGRYLIVGSASDLGSKGLQSARNTGLFYQPSSGKTEPINLYGFYSSLRDNLEVVGKPAKLARQELNIEGLAVRPNPSGKGFILAFFHRSNMAKNGHDSVIEYDLGEWLREIPKLASGAGNLKPRRIVRLNLGQVKHKGKSYDITLNDASFGYHTGKPAYLLPVSTETDYFDAKGNHEDGLVIFSGIALWSNIDDSSNGSLVIRQAPGENAPGQLSKFGKIEGLASFNSNGKDHLSKHYFDLNTPLISVLDVDSEIEPSEMKLIKW